MPSLASHWALHVKWFYFFKILSYCIKIENITYNFTPHLSQTFKFIWIHFPLTSFYVRRLTVPPPYLSQFYLHVYCRFHLSTSFIKTFYFVLEYSQSILKEINPEYSLGGLMFQYFGHLTWRANSLGKTLMLGKLRARRRRGWQRMRWLDGIIGSMDMNLSKLREMVKDGKPGVLQSMGSKRVGHDWATEQHHSQLTVLWKFQVNSKGNQPCILSTEFPMLCSRCLFVIHLKNVCTFVHQ